MSYSKYFQTKELVSKKVYEQYGESAIKFIDSRLLETIDIIREILGVPLTCNNGSIGGSRNYSGYREQGCGVGKSTGYHYKGLAVDLISSKMTAAEMRDKLSKNEDKLKYPIRIEKWEGDKEITWLHVDLGDTKGKKIYFFKA